MTTINDLHYGRKPGTARLSNRMNTIIWTIDECIKQKRIYPALILLYSGIDILGSLKAPDGLTTQSYFNQWVKSYFLTEGSFAFDESDLYGARCAIVHTMRYDSKNNTLKTLVYGLHGHDDDIKGIGSNTQNVGVYVEDLYEAFKKGYLRYLEELEQSSDTLINDNLKRLPKYVDLIPWN